MCALAFIGENCNQDWQSLDPSITKKKKKNSFMEVP